jgi:pyruvate-formate lyase-activating enzyme
MRLYRFLFLEQLIQKSKVTAFFCFRHGWLPLILDYFRQDNDNMKKNDTVAYRALYRYSTPVKFVNVLLSKFEKKCNIVKPSSRPYLAVIDVVNTCALRCYHCPTGRREYGRKPGFMQLSYLEEFLQRMGRYLYMAELFSWGEPLLHPEILKIIDIVRSHKILAVISSNFNTINRKLLEGLCDAGLDHLILSIDGSTQPVYSQYRVGGNLELVLENIRHLVEYRRRKKLRYPIIEWQFLIFDHNRHEVEDALKLSKGLGVDAFEARPGVVPEKYHEAWLASGWTLCPSLWDTITMQVDGGIVPCCNLLDKVDDFAESIAGPFNEIWHSSRYVTARSLFSQKLAKNLPPDLEHPCLSCGLVQMQPHLVHFFNQKKSAFPYGSGDDKTQSIDLSIAVRSGHKQKWVGQ